MVQLGVGIETIGPITRGLNKDVEIILCFGL